MSASGNTRHPGYSTRGKCLRTRKEEAAETEAGHQMVAHLKFWLWLAHAGMALRRTDYACCFCESTKFVRHNAAGWQGFFDDDDSSEVRRRKKKEEKRKREVSWLGAIRRACAW